MKLAAAIIAAITLLSACASTDRTAAAGSASATTFSYPYNARGW
jgi:hypothetical protein